MKVNNKMLFFLLTGLLCLVMLVLRKNCKVTGHPYYLFYLFGLMIIYAYGGDS